MTLLRLFSVAKTHCNFDGFSFTSVSLHSLKVANVGKKFVKLRKSRNERCDFTKKYPIFSKFLKPSFLLFRSQSNPEELSTYSNSLAEVLYTNLNTLLHTLAMSSYCCL